MTKSLAKRLVEYFTDFGDIDFSRKYDSFLREFFSKESREPYLEILRKRTYMDIAINMACNVSNLASVTWALNTEDLNSLIIIPITELVRVSCRSNSQGEKDAMRDIQKDETARYKYQSLEQIQRDYERKKKFN